MSNNSELDKSGQSGVFASSLADNEAIDATLTLMKASGGRQKRHICSFAASTETLRDDVLHQLSGKLSLHQCTDESPYKLHIKHQSRLHIQTVVTNSAATMFTTNLAMVPPLSSSRACWLLILTASVMASAGDVLAGHRSLLSGGWAYNGMS